jgi:hypothetical protein
MTRNFDIRILLGLSPLDVQCYSINVKVRITATYTVVKTIQPLGISTV